MTPDRIDRFCDPLGEALHQLRMSGVFYCQSALSAPWGACLPAMPGCLLLHWVIRGRCWLSTGEPTQADDMRLPPPAGDEETSGGRAFPHGADGRWLQAGDFVLVPHGQGHCLQSDPNAPTPNLFDLPREWVSERFEILQSGGGGEATQMVCAAVRLDHPVASQLLSSLPPVIHIDAADLPPGNALQPLLQLMADEARLLRTGAEAVITRMADILVIQAVRHWLQHDPSAQTGWLGALRDKRIGSALALIHRDPARGWTVASLAQASNMSRSAFAQRFTALVGVPVLEYLTGWRMNLSQTWLAQGLSMAEVAGRAGYQSEAAFARAFKRVRGTAPGRLRRVADAARLETRGPVAGSHEQDPPAREAVAQHAP